MTPRPSPGSPVSGPFTWPPEPSLCWQNSPRLLEGHILCGTRAGQWSVYTGPIAEPGPSLLYPEIRKPLLLSDILPQLRCSLALVPFPLFPGTPSSWMVQGLTACWLLSFLISCPVLFPELHLHHPTPTTVRNHLSKSSASMATVYVSFSFRCENSWRPTARPSPRLL